jgi:hypothetical protein
MIRLLCLILALLTAGCAPPPPPPKPDPTKQASYGEAAANLGKLNQEARAALASGDRDGAARAIQQGEPMAKLLLAVPEPPLAAMEAVSDRDQMYAQMLMANRHWTFARQLFVHNRLRWKNWRPQTPDTERRLAEAERGIAACDREMMRP